MNKKVSLIILISVCSLLVIVLTYFIFFRTDKETINNNLAKSGEEAIEIARRYVEVKYKEYVEEKNMKSFNDNDEYEIVVEDEGEVWLVWYYKKMIGILGGGEPMLYIEKDTGKVIGCSLQK